VLDDALPLLFAGGAIFDDPRGLINIQHRHST
jgi:hypothetical protein